MTSTRPLYLGLVGGALLSAGLLALEGERVAKAAGKAAEIMPLSEVKPHMKGYGLTVMSGTKPEKFDVEIISVLTNFRPNQDLILIKTPNHPRLEAAKTVAGMSGSPIYLNDKMIGAYAYGWTFGAEPVAGVTPIQYMIDEQKRPIPPLFLPRSGILPKVKAAASPTRSPRAFGAMVSSLKETGESIQGSRYDLDAHAKELAQVFSSEHGSSETLAAAETPLLFGGMSPSAMALAEKMLGPMGLDALGTGGTGKDDPDAPTEYEDGGAIGVQLLRGDISAMGLGTVTRVDGDKLVAFGHPMLGGGASDLPTAIAKVHWILASTNRSFKIGEAVRSMGTLVNDEQTAIVVDSKRPASSFPIHIEIDGVDGAPKTKWDAVASHDPFMAPMFTAMAIGSALETTTPERGDMTWRAHSVVKVAGYGNLELDDFNSSSGEPISADAFSRSNVVRAVGALLSNPFEQVRIEGVETKVKVTFKREISLIRATAPIEEEIDPGQPLHVKLTLVPYQGTPEDKVIEVPIPKELAGQDVDVDLTPGFEVDRPRAAIENLSDMMALLADPTYPKESLVASIRLPSEAGASFRGNIAERLPPGALDALKTAATSMGPETFGASIQTSFPMHQFVVGHDHVRVHVRPFVK